MDILLRDQCAGAIKGSLRLIARRLGQVEIGPRRDAAGGEHLLPLKGQIGVLEHGDIGSLVGLFGQIIDARQKGALFDVLAVGEADFRDNAADLASDINAGNRLESADRLDPRRPGFRPRLLHRNAGDRARLRGDGRLDNPRLDLEMEPVKPANQRGENKKHAHEHGFTHQIDHFRKRAREVPSCGPRGARLWPKRTCRLLNPLAA